MRGKVRGWIVVSSTTFLVIPAIFRNNNAYLKLIQISCYNKKNPGVKYSLQEKKLSILEERCPLSFKSKSRVVKLRFTELTTLLDS